MEIGIDIRTLMDTRYSGVSEYALRLIKEILRLDKENRYKLFYNSFKDIKAFLPEFKEDNAEIIGLNYPNKILNYLYFKFLKYPKIDKVLGLPNKASPFFMPHINFIALSDECRSLITVHDLSFLRHREFFSLRKNFWHYMIKVNKLLKQATRIIAVSENTKRDIVELCGINQEKIKVIYSGIGEEYKNLQLANFNLQKNTAALNYDNDYKRFIEVRKKYNLPGKFVLYLGTLEPRKNIEGIIQAYNQLRNTDNELNDIKLVIAGGLGWKAKKIIKEWNKSDFKNDIKLLGYIDSADKVYLYNLAKVFVYPSFYEGFGFPPLEAMACGIPVICSNSSSLPEIVGNAALMVNPYNITDIAIAIKQILINNDLRESLINKGFAQAEKFKWGKTAREYLEEFKALSK